MAPRRRGSSLRKYSAKSAPLVVGQAVEETDLLSRADALRKKLPVDVPAGTGWVRFPLAGCNVFNASSWNRSLPASYRVGRVTDAAPSLRERLPRRGAVHAR